jgi:hypothetical protein
VVAGDQAQAAVAAGVALVAFCLLLAILYSLVLPTL